MSLARPLRPAVSDSRAVARRAKWAQAALNGLSDWEAPCSEELVEFDGVRNAFDGGERARVLALVLDEVTVDGTTGEAELRLRGGL